MDNIESLIIKEGEILKIRFPFPILSAIISLMSHSILCLFFVTDNYYFLIGYFALMFVIWIYFLSDKYAFQKISNISLSNFHKFLSKDEETITPSFVNWISGCLFGILFLATKKKYL